MYKKRLGRNKVRQFKQGLNPSNYLYCNPDSIPGLFKGIVKGLLQASPVKRFRDMSESEKLEMKRLYEKKK